MLDYIRIGCAVPEVAVADTVKNAAEICRYLAQADEAKCDVVVFPELALTGYTCADLFFQQLLLQGAKRGLGQITDFSKKHPKVCAVVGLPVLLDGLLYNCAAVIRGGTVLGLVPKTFLQNHAAGEEERWFASSHRIENITVPARELGLEDDYPVHVGAKQVFALAEGVKMGVEICEDLFAPVPPSQELALSGAQVIVNPAASPQFMGRQTFRRELVQRHSENCRCIYAFCSAGWGESTRDMVFSGHSVIAQMGKLLKENEKLVDSDYLLVADADLKEVEARRCRDTSFRDAVQAEKKTEGIPVCTCALADLHSDGQLYPVDRQPFYKTDEDCGEVFAIQAAALARRLKLLNAKPVLGVSGGLDSTLALLVAAEAVYLLGRPASDVCAVTMPGFGTTDRTYDNAMKLMELLGVTVREISIKEAVTQHFHDIGHDITVRDLTYENAQARERTQILMDYAGKVGGIVVGTGDLSELALGWCTYNGDHMSMYSVNASVPKTMIPAVITQAAKLRRYSCAQEVLLDIIDTPISPELLPPDEDGKIAQQTEDLVGPYLLHDFFLYHTLQSGCAPKKLYAMACRAFMQVYDDATVKKWLAVFYRRFFSQQFKRNCMPEGVNATGLSLNPRGDWRMPGDAGAALWLEEVHKL